MRILKQLMLIVALAIVAAGCSKDKVSLDTTNIEIDALGGTRQVNLTANGDWTVNAVPGWMTVSPMSGTGNGQLTITAMANTSAESRTADITVSTKDNTASLKVTQGFAQNFITISPASLSCPYEGGVYELQLASDITWEMLSCPDWITCSVTSGTSSAVLSLTVDAVVGEAADNREADVTFGNANLSASVHVSQSTEIVSDFHIAPTALSFGYEGGAQTVTITTSEKWAAYYEVEWLSLNAIEGEGDFDMVVTVESNPVFRQRFCNITFVSETTTSVLTVSQEAMPNPHNLTVTPTEVNMPAAGGTIELSVECDTAWVVGSNVSWIQMEPREGFGNAIVSLTVEQNVMAIERHFNLPFVSANNQVTVVVHQAAGDVQPYINFAPDTVFVSPEGSLGSFEVFSNIAWTLQPSEDWINLLSTSGTNDGEVGFYVDKNPKEIDRVTTVKGKYNNQVLGQLVVYQPGRFTYLEASVTEVNAPATGSQFTISVSSNQAWFVNKGEEWVHYSPDSGNGDGQFVLTVDPMPGNRPRTTTIHLNGREDGSTVIITVNQSN